MKKCKNYLRIGIFTLVGLFVSCDKDSNEDINEDLSTNENQELIDDSLAKDLENFDYIVYQGKSYDFKEILDDKELLSIYKGAKYLGIDASEPRTINIFDTEEESDRVMSELQEKGRIESRAPERDYWEARVRIYTNVSYEGSKLTYNLRTTHDRRYTKNFPSWMNDKASSMVVDKLKFSYSIASNGDKIYRAVYLTCYEDYSARGRKATVWASPTNHPIETPYFRDNRYFPNLHSDGWGDKISSIRVGG